MAHDDRPAVPELDLSTDRHSPRPPRALAMVEPSLDDDPRDAPPLELSVEPSRPHATGVRSWPCPVCQTELARDVLRCPECGERLGQDPFAVPPSYALAPTANRASAPFWDEAAALLPIGVAKRLLVYPLLLAFFANLLVPCRFHATLPCLFLAAIGLVGVVASHVVGRSGAA